MIRRTLNRPLIKEWTSAPVLKPVTYAPRSFSTCRQWLLIEPHTAISRQLLLTSLSAARISNNARYSTSADKSSTKTKAVIPPPKVAASLPKPKISLHPAPKKLNEEPRQVIPPPLQSSTSTISASPEKPSARSVSNLEVGPMKAFQQDIADATKRGTLAPAPEGASKVAVLWHKFKELVKFYWEGLRLIAVTHRKEAMAIRRRVADAQARGEDAAMTRREMRFIRTYKTDIVKLFPFVLTVLILEEALPLIVLYLPGFLPSTCLLTSQHDSIVAKRRAKQLEGLALAKAELQRVSPSFDLSLVKEKGLDAFSGNITQAVAGILARSTWSPTWWQRQSVARHIAYLSIDDASLARENMGSRLSHEELVEALEERGIVVQSIPQQNLLDKLQWWLKGASDANARLGLILQHARNTQL